MKDLGCRRQPQEADPGNGCGMQKQHAVVGCSSRIEDWNAESRVQDVDAEFRMEMWGTSETPGW